MSDAFSDLWQTTNPAQSQPKQTLRTAQAQQSQPQAQLPWARQASKTDAFAILASTSSTPQRTTTPARSPAPPQRTARNGDAFGDLVSFGAISSTKNASTLSIAAQQSRPVSSQSVQQPSQQSSGPGDAWDQLDLLGASSSSTKSTNPPSSDPWDVDFFSAAPTPPQPQPRPAPASYSAQPAGRSTSSSASSNVFDLLGDFGEPSAAPAATLAAKSRGSPDFAQSFESTRSDTPGDFDFGDREYAGVTAGDASDDDILGVLAKPVSAVRKRPSPAPPERAPSTTATRNGLAPSSGRVSPPPHVIGQIVEMGFSVEQARVALASTPTGLDVQIALETLLQSPGGDSGPAPSSFRDEDSDLEHERERERERTRRLNHERRRRPDPSSREADDPEGGDPAAAVAAQADKLLTQASEIGLSMLSKANTFWNAGKERVQKAYEERSATSTRPSATSSPAPSKGRPRWMQESGTDDLSPIDGGRSTFKDHSDDEAPAQRPSRVDPQRAPRPDQPRPNPAQPVKSGSSARHLVVDESKSTGGYRSPFRGGRQTQTPSPQPTRGPSPLPPAAGPSAPPPPSFPSAASSLLASVAAHKAKANEAFKLGSYPAAISAYNAALELLPPDHMTRVSLLNNRALASIRIGEWKSAIDDCSTVINMIRPPSSGNVPPYLGPVPATHSLVQGAYFPGETLHLGDALLKALSRRAAAYEMGEKWPSALADWNATLQAALLPMTGSGGDIGKARSEANRGSERCKKMIGIVASGSNGHAPAPAPTPAAPARPVRRPAPKASASTAAPSEAVERLRAANAAASAEDQQKSELKDAVDARLQAWKGGKETNIRALMASLDTVLWPELGWQNVGMAELISPKQLKIKYMKAIAKLHPDKLNVGNTTVEQRMIANGVFATLNEAWVASNI